MLHHSKVGVLSHHANNNKPSVFKGCSVWHEINLGSVTAGQQMVHSIGLFKLSLRQRIFTKVYARYRKATRIRQYPNTSKTISTLWGRVESGSYQTAKGQSLMARDARQDKRLSRKEESQGINSLMSFSSFPPGFLLMWLAEISHQGQRVVEEGQRTNFEKQMEEGRHQDVL